MKVDPIGDAQADADDERFSFSALAEAIDDPVVIWSPLRDGQGAIVDFVYEYVNDAAIRTIGVPADELLGERLLDVLPAHVETGLFDRYRTVAETGRSDVIDIPWFEDGNVAGAFQASVSTMGGLVVSVARDVTEHVMAQHRLSESDRRTSILLDHATEVIFHIADGVVTWVTPSVRRLIGVEPATVIGTRAAAWCHRTNVGLLDRIADGAAMAGSARRGTLRRHDGSFCPVEVEVHALDETDAPGAVAGCTVVTVVRSTAHEEELRGERKRAEDRLAALLDTVPNPIFVTRTNGRATYSNAAFARLIGYEPDELPEIQPSRWIHPDDFAGVRDRLTELAGQSGTSFRHRHRLVHRDGHDVHVEATVANMSEDPSIAGWVVTLRDMTAELAAARRADRAEAHNVQLMAVVPDAVVLTRGGKIRYANAAAADLYGVASSDELIGRTSAGSIETEEELRRVREFSASVREHGHADEPLISWMRREDGTRVKIETRAALAPGGDGAVLYSIRDITEQDRVLTELAESEATGRFLVENSKDVLLRVDHDRRITFATTSTSRILEMADEDLIGAPVELLFHPSQENVVTDALDAAAEYGSALDFEARVKQSVNGSWRWVEVTVRTVVAAGDDSEVEYHVTMSDITEKRRDRVALAAREEWLATLVDEAPIGIFELDPEGACRFVNSTFCELAGVSGLDAVVGFTWLDLVHPDDRSLAIAQRSLASETAGGRGRIPIRLVRRGGVEVPTEVGVAALLDATGAVTGWLGTVTDVTDRERLEEARRKANELFVAAFDHAPVGLFLLSTDEMHPRLIKANTAAHEMTGMTTDEISRLDADAVTHPDDVEQLWAGRRALLAGEIDRHQMELRQRYREADEWRWFTMTRSIVRDSAGRAEYMINQMHDITERVETENEHYRLAVTDDLTGLSNRRHFDDRLANMHARLLRSNTSLGVVYLDLDHFKEVNDTLGHAAGDRVLIEVATTIRESVRPGDTVARLGGDEFAVLAEHERETDVHDMAERLQAAIRIQVPLPTAPGHCVTASIGVVSRRAADTSPAELLRLSDEAMYRAKRSGRARWHLAPAI